MLKEELIPVLHKLLQNKEGNTSQLILWGQYCSDSKARQKYHKKINLQTKYLMILDTSGKLDKWYRYVLMEEIESIQQIHEKMFK